ncbi:MAG TPA: hypothetical protein VKA46_31735 [Gemmataceae bacterium]|nr:hypothetical protein [Gemmataceae bacterium]
MQNDSPEALRQTCVLRLEALGRHTRRRLTPKRHQQLLDELDLVALQLGQLLDSVAGPLGTARGPRPVRA